MSSSLSSVVSDLVRAQMGSSVSNTVTDDDLDKHVAELILREAKKKAERYGQQGIRAYISNNLSDSNAPRPNKRFLTSIIKSTDEHNKSVLRSQAMAAQEAKRERDEQERRERRRRAEEAVEAERLRRSGRRHKRRRVESDEGWDRWDGRTAERKKIHRDWETWDGHDEDEGRRDKGKRRHRERSRSKEKRRARSPSPERTSSKRSKDAASPTRHKRSSDSSDRHRRRSKERERRRSRSPRSRSPPVDSAPRKRRRSHSPTIPPPAESKGKSPGAISPRKRSLSPASSDSGSPGPQLPAQLPSKMDKYFEETYDPRLDVEALPAAPKVPATGLIDNAEFEGWDAMLELIRLRHQDKLEKKRLERLGILPKDKKEKKGVVSSSTAAAVSDRWDSAGTSVMDIQYSKRGAVREWDLGKEGF